MPEQPTNLTEAILTIQHELQTALDYIETVVSQEPSQLGAAPSLITVDSLRIRIPVVLQVEQETHSIPAEEAFPALTGLALSREELTQLKARLLSRQGMLIKREQGQLGRFAKIRLTSLAYPSTDEGAVGTELVGNIELTFTRIPRTLESTETTVIDTDENNTEGNLVPNITGRTF
ncbi:hypothetical protein ACFLUP_04815 [Chloroflexota bacterium]